MASLTLQFEDHVMQQYPVGTTVTIGRLPDNTVVIDNAAVSSHHACVFRDGDEFILEDLQSTNGTFVNETRVVRQTLRHGDVVSVGRHKLVFDVLAAGDPTAREPELTISNNGETVFLDRQKHQRLLAIVMNAEARAGSSKGVPATTSRPGVLRVLAGPADRSQYVLEDHTSLIGRATWAHVRLKGWFKPNVAAAITRNQQGYVATRLRGKMLVNSQRMNGRYDLKDGDILSVGGLTLEFSLKDNSKDNASLSADDRAPKDSSDVPDMQAVAEMPASAPPAAP
jgi:pSer/pThr/pTyr-binding forkhead associated (FHA) protein